MSRSADHGAGTRVGATSGDQACRPDPEQIDVWEVHEAFSAQALGVLRELPTTELSERNARYGAIGVCVGSGQGVAIVLEREYLCHRISVAPQPK